MHTVSAAMKAKVEARVRECIAKSGVALPMPTILYDINSARLGGQANYRKNHIRVNPVFLNAYGDDYIKHTIGHEIAHLTAGKRYGWGISAHGLEWKNEMARIGLPAKRCHSYKVPEGVKVGKNVTKHACSCELCGYKTEVGSKVANKIKAGAVYRHRGCGGRIGFPLQLTGKLVSIPTTTARAHTVKTQAAPAPAKAGSKLDICRQLWATHQLPLAPQSRATMIDLFVRFAGCTAAGAATYYAKIAKE